MFSVGGNPGISVRIGCVSRYDRPAVDAYNARGLAAWKASVECAKTAPRDVCDARFYPVKLP